MTNYAVSELVCLLKNGQLARKYKVSSSFSKLKQSILDILKREGFIRDFNIIKGKSFDTLDIELSYQNGEPVIRSIEIISKPGQRKYTGVKDIPIVSNGLGMVILSTPSGVLSDLEAKTKNVGGELLLKIF
jgi:small subunit ribosomal protein S8